MIRFLRNHWCALTHGGGRVERDPEGRVNWRCARCGRWSDHPVSHREETALASRLEREDAGRADQ